MTEGPQLGGPQGTVTWGASPPSTPTQLLTPRGPGLPRTAPGLPWAVGPCARRHRGQSRSAAARAHLRPFFWEIIPFLQSPSSPGDLILVSALPPGLCERFIGRLRKKSRRLCLTKAFVTCTAEPADPRRAAVERWSARWLGSAQVWVSAWPRECAVTAGAGLPRVPGAPGHANPWGHPARAGLWRLTCCSVTLVSWEDCGSVGPGSPVWVPGFHG